MSNRRFHILVSFILAIFFVIMAPNMKAEVQPNVPRAVVMDLRFVLEKSKLGQLINEKLVSSQDALREESKLKSDELLKEEEEIAAKRDSLPSEEFLELAKNFENKSEVYRRDFELKSNKLNQDMKSWSERFMGIVRDESQYFVNNSDVDMIISAQLVISAKPSLDISNSMVELLDKKYIANPKAYEDIIFAPIFPPIETAPASETAPIEENKVPTVGKTQ